MSTLVGTLLLNGLNDTIDFDMTGNGWFLGLMGLQLQGGFAASILTILAGPDINTLETIRSIDPRNGTNQTLSFTEHGLYVFRCYAPFIRIAAAGTPSFLACRLYVQDRE